jgi:hypothetical protein
MGQKPSHSHYEKFKDEDGVEIPYPKGEEEHEQSTTNCCEDCCYRCFYTILLLCIMRS